MTGALALLTFRDCQRRTFPYALTAGALLFALLSRLFFGFSFGAERMEVQNLAVSAVFLTGLFHAAFLGATLLRREIDGGTLGLVFSRPITPGRYILGRYLGLCASAFLLCASIAAACALLFGWIAPVGSGSFLTGNLLAAWARALLAVAALEAFALALSLLLPRNLAPPLFLALFLAAGLAESFPLGILLPDSGLLGIEVGASPPWSALFAYSLMTAAAFLLLTFVLFSMILPIRGRS